MNADGHGLKMGCREFSFWKFNFAGFFQRIHVGKHGLAHEPDLPGVGKARILRQ